jgi:hypothetical protein
MTYYLAPSLAQLRAEVNKRWPNRSKVSDGWIADAAHAARTSDHNPNQRGSVNALDITAKDILPAELIAAAIAHPSTAYVIYNGHIYSRRHKWAKRPYTGTNPHRTHVHISITQALAAEHNQTTWFLRRPTPFPFQADHYFGLRQGGKSHNGTRNKVDADNVRRIQKAVGAKITGRFNPETKAKVAIAMWKQGLRTSGNVGPGRWRRLRL